MKFVRRTEHAGKTMKYIIFEDFSGQAIPFLFPHKVAHADMREQMPYSKILSAGYVELVNGKFHCHGGDAELNMMAGENDAACITEFFSHSN